MAPSTPQFDLKDRSVLITGANRGLGAALCKTILQYSPKIIHAGYRTIRLVLVDTAYTAWKQKYLARDGCCRIYCQPAAE